MQRIRRVLLITAKTKALVLLLVTVFLTYPHVHTKAENTQESGVEQSALSSIIGPPAPANLPPVEVSPPKPEPFQAPFFKGNFQCVKYVELALGIDLVTRDGYARTIATNSKEPQIGAVVKTRESWAGHVAVVVDIQDGYLVLAEANYTKGSIRYGGPVTIGRKLPVNSPKIVGYIVSYPQDN